MDDHLDSGIQHSAGRRMACAGAFSHLFAGGVEKHRPWLLSECGRSHHSSASDVCLVLVPFSLRCRERKHGWKTRRQGETDWSSIVFFGTTVGMNGELLKFLGGWLIWEWATLPAWSAREYTKFVFQCVKAWRRERELQMIWENAGQHRKKLYEIN